jgi:hypothetical protein
MSVVVGEVEKRSVGGKGRGRCRRTPKPGARPITTSHPLARYRHKERLENGKPWRYCDAFSWRISRRSGKVLDNNEDDICHSHISCHSPFFSSLFPAFLKFYPCRKTGGEVNGKDLFSRAENESGFKISLLLLCVVFADVQVS